ncbi:EF-hand domain-containing protein [Escherichia coli]|nr:EF-hand domain-containing protein [Escherichia coli]
MLLFVLAAVLPMCISGQLTTPEEDAAILFADADTNNDHLLELTEVAQYFALMDTDHDNITSRHEFALYWEAEIPELSNQAIHALFDLFDFNTNHELVLEDLDNFYPVMDTNDNGIVTEEEFLVYWIAKFNELGTHPGK